MNVKDSMTNKVLFIREKKDKDKPKEIQPIGYPRSPNQELQLEFELDNTQGNPYDAVVIRTRYGNFLFSIDVTEMIRLGTLDIDSYIISKFDSALMSFQDESRYLEMSYLLVNKELRTNINRGLPVYVRDLRVSNSEEVIEALNEHIDNLEEDGEYDGDEEN